MPYCLDSYGESNLASLEQQWMILEMIPEKS